jgi:hypothetical protein
MEFKKFKAAAVQTSPVFLNVEKTIDKAKLKEKSGETAYLLERDKLIKQDLFKIFLNIGAFEMYR